MLRSAGEVRAPLPFEPPDLGQRGLPRVPDGRNLMEIADQTHFVISRCSPLADMIQVKSRVVCKSERKFLDASVRLPWRPPSLSANLGETRNE